MRKNSKIAKQVLSAIIFPMLVISCSNTGNHKLHEQKSRAAAEDFSTLSNDQLCELSFSRSDPQVDEEIYVRNIFCDKVDLTCRKQGFQRNTLAMVQCIYDEKLKNQSPNVKACFDSGIDKNDVDGMTDCLVKKEQENEPQHIFPEQRQYIYERK